MAKLKTLADMAARAKGKPGKGRQLKSLSKRKPHPLADMPVTGNTETDDALESETVLAHMKQAEVMANAAKVNNKIQNNGYWIALVFVSSDQCNDFVRNAKLGEFADSSGAYYDGVQVAKALGVELTPDKVPFRDRGPDKRLVNEVGIIPEE